MSRSERLLNLLQVLRRYRHAISGQKLAEELGVGIRTLYRDIASLKSQGAMIEGGVGVGYLMKPGFMLPPLMFRSEELEAIVLGMRLVIERGDPELTRGARETLNKIAAVLPSSLQRELDTSGIFAGVRLDKLEGFTDSSILRKAIRFERKLSICYHTPEGIRSTRTVWPFALAFFEKAEVLMCWCELRNAFRNFRTNRISEATISLDRFPKNKKLLLEEWRCSMPERGVTILSESDAAED